MADVSLEKPFARDIIDDQQLKPTASLLQQSLANLIDLALILKQAHWNVIGSNFRSIHLQLDEILVTVRDASDEVAERLATLGASADGRSAVVAEQSQLENFPGGFNRVGETIKHVSNAMHSTVTNLRVAIEKLGELDPISEDLCIGIAGQLEKHLWMLQAQEA